MDSSPAFTALATSTRQLYLLLRCIAFTRTAEINITPDGLRFTVEEAHAIQGSTLLDKNLFSSYNLSMPEGYTSIPAFRINIAALLETLQIFGISDSASTSSTYRHQNGGLSSSYAAAFSTPALNLGGTCRMSYAEIGAPLCLTIDEGNVKTVCEMNTYGLPPGYDEDIEIPLDRNNLVLKVIMRSTWLADAIAELSNTNPETLVLNASSKSAPLLSLEGQGGPFGDTIVNFMPESKPDASAGVTRGKVHPQITETFAVNAPSGSYGRVKQSYKFDLIKKAGRAMQLASKVSVRQDNQGVLSLQFMIDGAGGDGSSGNTGNNTGSMGSLVGAKPLFVDFRFVPLFVEDESEAEAEGAGDETQSVGSAE